MDFFVIILLSEWRKIKKWNKNFRKKRNKNNNYLLQEILVCFQIPSFDSLFLGRRLFTVLHHLKNVSVQILCNKLRSLMTSMSIINTEKPLHVINKTRQSVTLQISHFHTPIIHVPSKPHYNNKKHIQKKWKRQVREPIILLYLSRRVSKEGSCRYLPWTSSCLWRRKPRRQFHRGRQHRLGARVLGTWISPLGFLARRLGSQSWGVSSASVKKTKK